MSGLVGSSNSPISGMVVLGIIAASLLFGVVLDKEVIMHHSHLVIALILYMSTGLLAIGCIANDNFQDLKTGYLLGATPWRQQLALIYGVLVSALVIPTLLELLYLAYGFPGSLPRPGMDPSQVLAAPQAVLMSMLAKGVITHQLNWDLIGIGILIGVVFLIIDALILKRYHARLPLFAIGFGIYLPLSMTTALILGTLLSYAVNLRVAKTAKLQKLDPQALHAKHHHRGILTASGMVVGESLIGVLIAFLIVGTNNQYPIALVGKSFTPFAGILGTLVFISMLTACYSYMVNHQHSPKERL